MSHISPVDIYPRLIISGFPKCGTSSLYTWLADHPQIVGSIEKETYYFVDPDTHMFSASKNIINGLEGYSALFPSAKPGQILMEATPAYVYHRAALEKLPDIPSKPMFIFLVRDPADQIFSLFRYFKNNWNWIPQTMSFAEFLAAVEAGTSDFGGNELARNALRYAKYVDYLLQWRARVGEDRMRVYVFDDLCADQTRFMQELAISVGIDPTFYANYAFPRDNETYEVRSHKLQQVNVAVRGLLPKGRAYEYARDLYRRLNTNRPRNKSDDEQLQLLQLREKFAPDNTRLANEFGLDVSRW